MKCPSNGDVTIKFETDAEDKYFNDHLGLGQIELSHDIVSWSKLRTGIYTLKLKPSLAIKNLQTGRHINFWFKVLEKKQERFSFEIPIEISDPISKPPTPPPPPPGPPGPPQTPFTRIPKTDHDSNDGQNFIDNPEIKAISKEKSLTRWNKFFNGNEKRGAFVEISSEGKLKIWVNISHPSLVQYQKLHPDYSTRKIIDRYVYYVGYQTWALYLISEGEYVKYPENYSIKQLMEAASDSIAFFGLGYLDASR